MKLRVTSTRLGSELFKLELSHPRGAARADVFVGGPSQLSTYVAEGLGFGDDDEVVEAIREEDPGQPVAYLEWIESRSSHRGVGTKMLDAVLGFLDDEGVTATYLWSAPDEKNAEWLEAWYARHGFVRVDEPPDPLRETVPMVRR